MCALRLAVFANSRPHPGCGHRNFFEPGRGGGRDGEAGPPGPFRSDWMETRFCDFDFAFDLSMAGCRGWVGSRSAGLE